MSRTSLLSRLSGVASASVEKLTAGPSAIEIKRRLEQASAAIPALEQAHREAAVEAESGVSGAEARLATCVATLQAGRDRVATLQAAHFELSQREAARHREAKAQIRASRVMATRKHLEARDAAIADLALAAEAITTAWRKLLASTQSATASYPEGRMPDGSLTGLGDLRNALAHELHRVGRDPKNPTFTFPGAKEDFVAGVYPSLNDYAKAATARAMAALKSGAA